MKVSLNWIRDYVDIDSDAQEIARKLTLAGLAVDAIDEINPFPGVIVGRVLEVTKHPNADKLSLTLVDLGTEQVRIVCGASNVAVGQWVPVATVGSILPGNFEIKKAKIRGEESLGMICSKSELGFETGKSPGIWELDPIKELRTGQPFASYLGLEDVILDIDVTSNRPDCLSMIGIAREIAILEGTDLRLPDTSVVESDMPVEDLAQVSVEDSDGCPRYTARVIQGVTIGASPSWLSSRLEAIGLRSINNIVDVTNFVMMETGQPLHAFDYDQIQDHQIVVRRSRAGEMFQTLDGKSHTLNEDVVMICDSSRSIALGGIMGGKNSEVTDATKNILLESATFDLKRTRRASRLLGIQSDASNRFGRGVDPEGTITALNRAMELIRRLSGGKVAKGFCEKRATPDRSLPIELKSEDVEKLLGMKIPDRDIESILKKLGCQVEQAAGGWRAVPPSFRGDLNRSVDLIEEIVRIFGYDQVPYSGGAVVAYAQEENRSERFTATLRNCMKELSFNEVVTNPMVRAADQALVKPHAQLVRLLNPINEEMAVMRASLLPSLLEVVRGNLSRKNHDIRIFEIGRCFSKQKDNELALESPTLAACVVGNRQPGHWSSKPEPFDFFDLKNVISSVCRKFLLDTLQFSHYHDDIFTQDALQVTGQSGVVLGYFGKLNKSLLRHFDIDSEVWYIELPYLTLQQHAQFKKTYQPISKFPSIERDLAFVLDRNIPAADVLRDIKGRGGENLATVDVFDLYTGNQVGAGQKSLAFNLQFRSSERTLTDIEVDRSIQAIVQSVQKKFNASLR